MYARRLKLMEALERKFAPLERYHVDVVGLCEDTREEIAFLREKLGMTDPVAEDGTHEKGKREEIEGEMEEGDGIDAEDHGLKDAMTLHGQRAPETIVREIHSKTDADRIHADEAGTHTLDAAWDWGLWRNKVSSTLFDRSSSRRAKDITPTRLQMLRRTRTTTTSPVAPQQLVVDRPLPDTATAASSPRLPRRRLSKVHRVRGKQLAYDQSTDATIRSRHLGELPRPPAGDPTMANTFANAITAKEIDQRPTDIRGNGIVGERDAAPPAAIRADSDNASVSSEITYSGGLDVVMRKWRETGF
ncbi:MAG: hypothetical protein LQ338_004912 [Usnochroma carphineum]|nr:MAG: hypothetical protein LQ338_004912 [Usnochroma carphineum]